MVLDYLMFKKLIDIWSLFGSNSTWEWSIPLLFPGLFIDIHVFDSLFYTVNLLLLLIVVTLRTVWFFWGILGLSRGLTGCVERNANFIGIRSKGLRKGSNLLWFQLVQRYLLRDLKKWHWVLDLWLVILLLVQNHYLG